MNIDRCNSIFELFAAFNFAHAIISEKALMDSKDGATYADIIINTHLRIFNPFFDSGNSLKQEISGESRTCEELIEQNVLDVSPESREQLVQIKYELSQLNGLVNLWQDDVDNEKSIIRIKINGIFPFLSFLTAIFCIGVLGVAISESPFKHSTLLGLFLPTLITYIWIFKKNGNNGYMLISYIYFILVFILIVTHLVFRSYGVDENGSHFSWLCFFDNNDVSKHILIFFCLGLPFSHFIIFLFWGNKKMNKIKETKESEIKRYNQQLNGLKNRLNSIANVVYRRA